MASQSPQMPGVSGTSVTVQRPGMPAQRPAAAAASAPAQEFVVRVPQITNKKYSIMKFGSTRDVDFTKCGQASLAKENNLKEFKQANDLDQMPKFGAGSEYGRERRDIARKKKYGIMLKNYRVDEQPWQLTIGKGKESRKFKGSKEGGILENASYYIFTKCPDGAFEAHPLEEWYNFNPVINYKFLNSEEAEEEFSRRDKTLNYFSIMLKKRLNNEDDADQDLDGSESKGKKRKKKSDLVLTDMDDWAMLSDDDAVDSDEDDDEAKQAKKAKAPKKSKRKEKKNLEDEAMEESDDVDEGQEVDYMTDTDSDDEDMYNQEGREKLDKYEEKGVAEEDGLRKQLNSDEEEEEEEEKEENEQEEEEEEEVKPKAAESGSDSSSSSDSDSDEEKEESFSSALFMPRKKEKNSGRSTPLNKADQLKDSKSRTPTPTDKKDTGGLKRKQEDRRSPVPKKSKTESPVPTEGASAADGDAGDSKKNTFVPINCEGISEEAVRRYLIRKPMTTKDLLQKFKSKKTGLSNEQLVKAIVTILKKINPEQQNIDGKMHLYLKHE